MNRLLVQALPRLLLFLSAFAAAGAAAHTIHDHRPEQSLPATESAPAYLREFRETGDDHALERAWAVLLPALERDEASADIFTLAAMVAQSRHEFERAERLLQEALTRRPDDQQALLLQASIHLVRGRGQIALEACRRLHRAPALVALTCRSRVALSRGDFADHYRGLSAALAVYPMDEAPDDISAWALAVAGDLAAASGEHGRAEGFFRDSLERSESTQVRAALVDVLLQQDKLEAACAALDLETRSLALRVRQLLVAERLGRGAEVRADIHRADAKFKRWVAARDWRHAREMALFYLDVKAEPLLAQRLAVINLSLQREPEDYTLYQRAVNPL